MTDLDALLRQHPLPPGTFSDVAAEWPTGNSKLQVVVESSIPPHIHDDTDHVLFIARGTGAAYLADETRRIKPGAIIFIPHGILHGFEKDSSSEYIVMLVVETPSQCHHAKALHGNRERSRFRALLLLTGFMETLGTISRYEVRARLCFIILV